MLKEFILPDIGEGIVECELLEWLIKEGDHIEEDQPVAEVMTDKATVQIPAMHSGVVKKLHYTQGDIAKVHAPLFAMEVEGIGVTSDVVEAAEVAVEKAAVSVEAIADTASQLVSEDFILPDIGEGIVECELVKWLVEEGQQVQEDQPVVEVMTDKAVVEIPAKYSGVVVKKYYQQGDIAKVHTPLFSMQFAGSAAATTTAPQPQTESAATEQDSGQVASQAAVGPRVNGKAIASPAVRRLARERNIDLTLVPGSGKKGRVMKADLDAYQQQAVSASVAESGGKAPLMVESQDPAPFNAGVYTGDRSEPLRGIKAAMARQMSQSVFTIPHFTVSDELEMDNLMALRQQLKAEFAEQGVKLSFMPFIVKAMSLALQQFPIINSQVNDDCTEITYKADHNIGVAVDSKIGLLVPNIKQVQNLSLLEVAKELQRLVESGREGKLAAGDLQGGTISISNVGVLGGTVATPVINKPESAIVALGKVQRLPRFDQDDNVRAVNIMQVSWSGDHRIIDGATMVRFNNLWLSYLQNPVTMLTHLR